MVTADTWKCHICGEERPDDKISVVTKPLIINGQACGEQNIRYCNDRPACIEGANEFSFFKEVNEDKVKCLNCGELNPIDTIRCIYCRGNVRR